jgi:tetratricopeptide (TPR) repeat protein
MYAYLHFLYGLKKISSRESFTSIYLFSKNIIVKTGIILLIAIAATTGDGFAQRNDSQSDDEQLAAQLMMEGDFEKAAAIYEELFEKSSSPNIYNNYLRCLIELEEYRKAQRLVGTQIDNNPGRARFEVDLGYVYTRAGNTRKAKRQLEGLIDDMEIHPSVISDLANAFLFRDFVEYALQTYQKGREHLGFSYPFNMQLAGIYEQKKEYDAMMQEYVELAILDDSYLEQVQGILQDAINNDPDFEKSDALRRILLQGSQRNFIANNVC